MSDKPRKGHVAEVALVRKNMDMSVTKLAAARRFLGARTDTETIELALDTVIFQGEVASALDRLADAGGLVDIYAREARPATRDACAAAPMRDRFAIDSNVYIGALRNRDAMRTLQEFLRRAGPRVSLAGTVILELRAGARTPPQSLALDHMVHLYHDRERFFGASFSALAEAGRVLAAAAQKEFRGGAFPASFVNDAILAASCRETSVVLITDNTADFTTIQRHLRGFRFLQPWPLA